MRTHVIPIPVKMVLPVRSCPTISSFVPVQLVMKGCSVIQVVASIFFKNQARFTLVLNNAADDSGSLYNSLKVDLSPAGEDCQHAVTDESLCTVTGCALGTDVCHWMFKTKVNMVQG